MDDRRIYDTVIIRITVTGTSSRIGSGRKKRHDHHCKHTDPPSSPYTTHPYTYFLPIVAYFTMSSNSNNRRMHGFVRPFSKMQIATWIALPTLVVEFLVLCSPLLPLVASVLVTLVFITTSVMATLSGYLATALNPMDHRLFHDDTEEGDAELCCKKGCCCCCCCCCRNLAGTPSDYAAGTSPVETKYCWICEHDVACDSMHCKYCNKCVGAFDHHCQWLNTCIGSRNYPYFWRTIVWLTLVLVVHVSVNLGLVVDSLLQGTSQQRASDYFGLPSVVLAFQIAFSAVDGIALTLVLQLLVFHIKLRRQGLTTYRFILQDAASKREKHKLERETHSRRIVAMGRAKRSRQYGLYWRLWMGQYAGKIHSCLDPLPTSHEQPQQQHDENPHPTTFIESQEPSQQQSNGDASHDKVNNDDEGDKAKTSTTS
jgi:palmitoyltransferase